MTKPIISACLQVGARLLLLRFLYLCYVNFSRIAQAYPHSSLHATLTSLGLPEELVNYPFSGLGSVSQLSLAIEIIVTAITFVDGFSRRFAESIDSAADPQTRDKPIMALYLLSQLLRPFWMRMHYVTVAWMLIRLFRRQLPAWAVIQSGYGLYLAYLPFVIFVALWVLYAVVATVWYDILWQAVYTISTRIALRDFSHSSSLSWVVCFLNILKIKIPSFDILFHATDFLGWPVLYATVDYDLFTLTETMLREALELSHSWCSLFQNASTLWGLVFL
ncbi:hypothetical protein RRF57_004895 [Xylaria bambusicola]|uniref:Uncharacterized protein n=1 Tax=Xylaria bambusicola TaxID=326684 RepID=A0AAN7YXC7_9PEZI